MKRLVTLAIMVAFLLGTVGMVKAAELTISGGDFRVHGNYVTNPNFDSDLNDDEFNLYQRFRTTFNFVANENLRAVVQLQFGGDGSDARWGSGIQNAPARGGFADVNFRQAYLQFLIPNTEMQIKAGWQYWALPNTFGSHIHDSRAPAIIASMPINEMIGLTFGYSRCCDPNTQLFDTTEGDFIDTKDERNSFFVIVPVTMDGFKLNPFIYYMNEGKYRRLSRANAGGGVITSVGNEKARDYIFGGINATVTMFDPIVVHADFNYGTASKDTSDTKSQSGWIADLAVGYMMDMMTPMVFGLYESGESKTSNTVDKSSKRMPRLFGDLAWSSFSTGGSQFGGTSWYQGDNLIPGFTGGAIGRWGVGLKIEDISFMDKLNHKFLLAYYQGTNEWSDDNQGLMTTKDSLWELNFDTSYQMYENLAAILELGYLSPSLKDADDRGLGDDASFKAAAGFRYRF